MRKLLRILVFCTLLTGLCMGTAMAEGVVINEVMTRNTLYAPVEGMTFGWVEIQNASDAEQDITGWFLVVDNSFKKAFCFPQRILEPGETLLVYAAETTGAIYEPAYMAPFKLSKGGAEVTLIDRTGNSMDSVSVPGLKRDASYMRDLETGVWEKTDEPTPNAPNVVKSHDNEEEDTEEKIDEPTMSGLRVEISEVMPSNKTYLAELEHPDWLEIHNSEDYAIDLTGWYIGDDPEKVTKGYSLDGITLEPDAYLLLIADGTDMVDEDGNIHVNFKLSKKGETLVLTDSEGRTASRVSFETIERNKSLSLTEDGTYTTEMTPTPGSVNRGSEGLTQEQLQKGASTVQSQNTLGLYINEIMATTNIINVDKQSYDWVEIANYSANTIDLSGFGLSDNPNKPRKWVFPDGSVIAPGGFITVVLTGEELASNPEKGIYRASFSLGVSDGETLCLCTAAAEPIDQVTLGVQRQNISFGRSPVSDRYVYFAESTPGSQNSGTEYAGIADKVSFSVNGGVVSETSVTVELTSEPGTKIYYTTDCTEPTANSKVYSAPITLDKTTVIRAVAAGGDAMVSQIATETYIFGETTQLRVVSVVAEPDSLYGESGIITRSSKRTQVKANIEVYLEDGTQILDEGCRMKLMGSGSLKQAQKSIKILSDGNYGSGKFKAQLFDNREYTKYKAFILRSSGQDCWKSRMLDSILTGSLAGTPLFYQESETCVVYVNGKFYGHMNMRERTEPYSLAQFHGWDSTDGIQILQTLSGRVINVDGNGKDDWSSLISWVSKNDMSEDSNVDKVAESVDIDNYLYYVAFQMYIANNDLGNCMWYRNTNGDNKWRWIAYDVDLSWQTDQNSYGRWMKKGGVGSITTQDNTLFIRLMKNKKVKDRFFTILGELMANNFESESLKQRMLTRADEIRDDAVRTFEFYDESPKTWEKWIERLTKYATTRPGKLLGYIQEETGFSDETMRKYFGKTMDAIAASSN